MRLKRNNLHLTSVFGLMFLLFCLNSWCTKGQGVFLGDLVRRDTVTFIFAGFPNINRDVKFGDSTIMKVDIPDVLFQDEDKTIVIRPKVGIRNDTIAIHTSSASIVVNHKINAFETIEY